MKKGNAAMLEGGGYQGMGMDRRGRSGMGRGGRTMERRFGGHKGIWLLRWEDKYN